MDSVSPTSVHNFSRRARAGFSLTEMVVALSLAAVVGAGMLSAYLFIARSIVRLANYQRLEVASRRALQTVNTDLRMAVGLVNPTSSSVTITVPTASSTTTVAYVFDPTARTLTRTPGGMPPVTLLTGVQSLTFNYYDKQNASTSSPVSVKQVDLNFSTAAGSSDTADTRAHFTAASARILLRNKPLLQ